jgi:Uncharacterised nucleotidyltransferase
VSDLLWSRVDALAERAPTLRDLRAHGLHLLAARRWRQLGRPVPENVALAERYAAMIALAAPAVLREVQNAYDGQLLLQKGPELAARFPDAALRPYGDLDLLAADPGAAHRALLEAGWLPSRPGREGFHHLQPLQSPRFPLRVEIHERPLWLPGVAAPRFADLVGTRSAAVGTEGMLAVEPAQHAVLVAVHAWLHEPLGRLLNLIDVAVLAEEAPRAEIERVAERYGAARVWRATMVAVDPLLLGRETTTPATLRRAVHKLAETRERTVAESHLSRAAGIFVALPPRSAILASLHVAASTIRPYPEEGWSARLRRAVVTLGHLRRPRSEHESAIGYR